MKAGIYQGKKKIELTELPTPKPKEYDVVIQNMYAGVCGSDVAVYNYGSGTGHKIDTGMEFGHEMVSQVVAIGEKVKDFQIGDRVYPYPLFARGDVSRAGSLGGFSEYILIPNAILNQQLYLVPKAIPDRIAAMVEPFTVGTRAAKQTYPQKGEQAIVFGAGTIGTAAAIALKYLGVSQVLLVDFSDFRLGIAKKLGFETVNPNKENVQKKAVHIFGEAEYSINGKNPNAQIYIDAAGHSSVLEQFFDYSAVGSRFITVGVNNNKVEIDMLKLIFGTKSVGGSGGYRPEDVKTVFEIMQSNQFDLNQLITQEFDWDNLEKAIQTASDITKAQKVLINYHVH